MSERRPTESAVTRLTKILEGLEITAFQNEGGGFTVMSSHEPAFCFERDTLTEIDRVVDDALVSYFRIFHGANVKMASEREPIARSVLPVRRLRPLSRVRPAFSGDPREAE